MLAGWVPTGTTGHSSEGNHRFAALPRTRRNRVDPPRLCQTCVRQSHGSPAPLPLHPPAPRGRRRPHRPRGDGADERQVAVATLKPPLADADDLRGLVHGQQAIPSCPRPPPLRVCCRMDEASRAKPLATTRRTGLEAIISLSCLMVASRCRTSRSGISA